jgi:hypothetical protein
MPFLCCILWPCARRSQDSVRDRVVQTGSGTNHRMFGSDHRPVVATYNLKVNQRLSLCARSPEHRMAPPLSFFSKVRERMRGRGVAGLGGA